MKKIRLSKPGSYGLVETAAILAITSWASGPSISAILAAIARSAACSQARAGAAVPAVGRSDAAGVPDLHGDAHAVRRDRRAMRRAPAVR